MSTFALLGIAAASIALLLLLIIRFQVPAFGALMAVSVLVALVTGMPVTEIVPTVISGMGGTLGSVAILVAFGAMLGRMIEMSGGASSLAGHFTRLLGPTRVPAALTAAALVLAIPVFFDVGFIILVPIIYGFCKAAGVNPVKYGLPVAGIMLAVHVVVPPHPGIVGGAALLNADIGWIMVIGLGICLVLAVIAQLLGRWLNRRDYAILPATAEQFKQFGQEGHGAASSGQPAAKAALPSPWLVLLLIAIPLLMIMSGTMAATLLPSGDPVRDICSFIGSPVVALLVAVALALLLLARNQRWSREHASQVMESALPATAMVILVTGAGGVFAKVLTVTGIGAALSQSLAATDLPLILLAFIISLALRAAQGSATVAILTTGGLLAETISSGGYSVVQTALLTVAIGFGGLGLSHVNDSGFWIVTRYLGLNVADGLRTWTVLTTVLGVSGFLMTWLLWALIA